jgi:hypothetical protein
MSRRGELEVQTLSASRSQPISPARPLRLFPTACVQTLQLFLAHPKQENTPLTYLLAALIALQQPAGPSERRPDLY